VASNAFTMMDDKALCALDARLDYFEVQTRSGHGRGRLPVAVIKRVDSLNDDYRRYLGLSSREGSAALVGGGLARMRSGNSLMGIGEDQRRGLLATLVASAIDRAAQTTDLVISPFLTSGDLPAYLDAAPSASLREHGVWCALELSGATDIEDFLRHIPKQYRQTWKRDIRTAEALGLDHDSVPLSDDVVAEAAAGIADVSRRNDLSEPIDIVKWRVSNFQRRPGKHFFIRTLWRGNVIAYSLCRTFEDTIDAHSIGISDVPEIDRRAVYHIASMLGPLRVAIDCGARRLEFGIGHETPKLNRGCIGERIHFADLLPTG